MALASASFKVIFPERTSFQSIQNTGMPDKRSHSCILYFSEAMIVK
jgi:hypothetical protein